MVKQVDVQLSSFAGGEFSPNLQVRTNLEKYPSGLKRGKNMILHQTGGASNRPGTVYVAETKYSAKKSRVIEFEYSIDDNYYLEVGEYYIRFFDKSGPITKASADAWVTTTAYDLCDYVTNGGNRYYCAIAHTSGTFATDLAAGKWMAQSGTIYEIPTPYKESDLEYIKYTQSGDKIWFWNPDYHPRVLTRYDDADWTIEEFANEYGPLQKTNTDEASTITPSAVTGSITLTATKDIFNAGHVGSIWKLTHAKQASSQTVTWSNTDIGFMATGLPCGKTWRVVSHGNWEGTIKVQKSEEGDLYSPRTDLRTFSSKLSGTPPLGDYNANLYGDLDEFAYIRLEMTAHGVSSTVTVDLNCDEYDHHGYVEITSVTNSKSAVATVIKPLGATNATSEWNEGSWSTYRGFPTAGIFYQDRICPASTSHEPQTIWPSQTGDYTNFKVSDPVVDTDSMSINLASRTMNDITALDVLGKIIAITTNSEWTVGPGNDGIFTPTSIVSDCVGKRGAANVDSLVIGNRILYIQSQGKVVRSGGFDAQAGGFKSENISIFSSHLFKDYEVVDWCYQQEPDSIIWAVRSDGRLLTLTYLEEHSVVGWTWHETYSGDDQFESICSIPNSTWGIDQVCCIVKRGNKRYVEYLAPRLYSKDLEDQVFMDSAKEYDSTPTTTITGLSHLEGRTVAVLADGVKQSQKTVSSGQITLDSTASHVWVGLPYVADLWPLSLEIPGGGTLQRKHTAIPEVTISFEDSKGGWYGFDEDHLDELQSDPDIDDDELYTGDRVVTVPSDFGLKRSILIRQIDPYPITVNAIVPTLSVA